MYLIFMKKSQHEQGPSLVSRVINDYCGLLNPNDAVIAFPGDMDATQKSFDTFMSELKLPYNTYFIRGENNYKFARNQQLKNTVIHYTGGTKIKNFKFSFTGNSIFKGHCKMMFFIDTCKFKGSNIIQLDSNINVPIKAALIGSSNIDYTTYFGATPFSEADVLLIDEKVNTSEEDIINFICSLQLKFENQDEHKQNHENSIIYFKQIENTTSSKDQDILLDILRDALR